MSFTRRLLRRWIPTGVLLLALLVLVAPWLLSETPLRNWILAVALSNTPIEVMCDRATIGWIAPVSIGGLTVRSKKGAGEIRVDDIRLEHSPLGIWWNRPELGELRFEKPRFNLAVTTPWFDETPRPTPKETESTGESVRFHLIVHDASLTLRQSPDEAPFLELEPIQLDVAVRPKGNGYVLRAEPIELLQRRPLTVDDFRRGFELVVPLLANSANVDGEVSLRLDEFEMPYGEVDLERRREGFKLDGHLVLHQVSAGLKNPVSLQVAATVASFLNTKVPERVKLADEADVHFHVENGRVFHEGFKFGLPDVADDLVLQTSGSVGLDHSLDLTIDVPLGGKLLGERPWLRRLSDRPLRLTVRGTIEEPKVGLPQDRTVLEELARRLLDAPRTGAPLNGANGPSAAAEGGSAVPSANEQAIPLAPLADAVIEGLGELLERRRQRRAPDGQPPERDQPTADRDVQPDTEPAPAGPSLLDRLRARRDPRRSPRTEDPPRKREF